MSAPLLVELLTEELPPKALKRLAEAFAERILDGLKRTQLQEPAASISVFATPRRLAVLIPNVLSKAQDRLESKQLMSVNVAFGVDGKPTTALTKRLEKEGALPDQLERKSVGDAEYVFLRRNIPGLTLTAGLQSVLQESVGKLPIPKVMSYQLADGVTTVQFVRPAHGLTALHGDTVVDVSVLGLKAGRLTHGHRFQGAKDIELAGAGSYVEALATSGNVIASFDTRRAEIDHQLRERAATLGASLGPEEDVAVLLDEVTALVEYPTVYVGAFEEEFLEVPQECLILTMRQNQKYFPLFNASQKLLPKFLIVSNMRIANPRYIISGNQRVVRPRLEDARFFYNQDRKVRLSDRVSSLAIITYHNRIGSQLERVERLQAIARFVALGLGADVENTARAAWLSKADLVTGMVGEFPELQGTMGRYYALSDSESPDVANAIEDHYKPRFAKDSLPEHPISISVAVADRILLLVSLARVGERPTGDKDPFGFRRSAIGLIRMLVEKRLPLDLLHMLNFASQTLADSSFADSTGQFLRRQWEERTKSESGVKAFGFGTASLQHDPATVEYTYNYVLERLRSYLLEGGRDQFEVEAVLAGRPTLLDKLNIKLEAVHAFRDLPDAASLAAANKRIRNILRQAEHIEGLANPSLLIEEAERELYEAMIEIGVRVQRRLDNNDYKVALHELAVLRPHVDRFFDQVLVNCEEASLRENRLKLLFQLDRLMNRVADISKLAA